MDESDFSFFKGSKDSKESKHNRVDEASVSDSSNHTSSCSYFQSDFNKTVQRNVIISLPADEDEYNRKNPNAGIALIFNHKYIRGQQSRAGTEKDREAIRETLLKYGFDVRVYNNLTYKEIEEKLKTTAREDHSQNDCFVVVLMTHGTEGRVYARDVSYPVHLLWSPFLGNNCKTLINKPKLFFIQACRGNYLDEAVAYMRVVSQSLLPRAALKRAKPPILTYAIPNTADILVMYSTFEKYYSFRNVDNGSWFIQSLCVVFNEAAATDALSEQGAELLRLLTAVNRKVAYEYQSNTEIEAYNQKKEMPNFLSTLTKTFYLRVKRRPDNVSKKSE